MAVNKYDNIVVTRDLNVDFCNIIMDTNNYLCDIIETFSLTNIVNFKTCFKTLDGTLLDLMLTNKPKSLCKTCTREIGLSGCHKMIVTFLRASLKEYLRKTLFIEITNILTKMVFFMNLI